MLHVKLVALFGLAAFSLGATAEAPEAVLGEEAFGNRAVRNNREWPKGLLACVNDKRRVYRRWVNGNEDFCFRGNLAQLNEAIARFAKIDLKKRVLVLEPEPGMTRSFKKKQVPYRWRINAPSGLYRAYVKRQKGEAAMARMFVHLDKMDFLPSELVIPASIHLETPCLDAKDGSKAKAGGRSKAPAKDSTDKKTGAGKQEAKSSRSKTERTSRVPKPKKTARPTGKIKREAGPRQTGAAQPKGKATAKPAPDASQRRRHALTFIRKVRRLWEKAVRAAGKQPKKG